jgi:hypothetical protein
MLFKNWQPSTKKGRPKQAISIEDAVKMVSDSSSENACESVLCWE